MSQGLNNKTTMKLLNRFTKQALLVVSLSLTLAYSISSLQSQCNFTHPGSQNYCPLNDYNCGWGDFPGFISVTRYECSNAVHPYLQINYCCVCHYEDYRCYHSGEWKRRNFHRSSEIYQWCLGLIINLEDWPCEDSP